MVQQRFGDLHVFAEAIRRNPDAPDVRGYLKTLDLTEQEAVEVIERFGYFCRLMKISGEAALPEIALGPVQGP